MQAPIRTLLVEDHRWLAEPLRVLLNRDSCVTVIGQVTGVDDALAEVPRRHPDVVVVDLKLSGRAQRDGLHLISQLTQHFPAVASVAITTVRDDELLMRAAMAGARGHALKDTDTVSLVRAIRGAYSEHHGGDTSDRIVTITEQDRAMLKLIARGFSNQGLAAELDLPETRVRAQVRRMFSKLEVSTRAEAVYLATKENLI